MAARRLHVILRKVSPAIERCELTCISREPISLGVCQDQHAAYTSLFTVLRDEEGFNITVDELQALPDFPDSVFVEDTAILFPECAIVSNPGAASRRGEVEAIIEPLARVFANDKLHRVTSPALVDGGDVLVAGKFVFIGQSTRTNAAAVEQMQAVLKPHGYTCVPCVVRECLHLKSAVSLLTSTTVLINPNWIDADVFTSRGIGVVVVPDPINEPNAANVLSFRVEKSASEARRVVVVPVHYPLLLDFLSQYFALHPVDQDAVVALRSVPASELAKAEGAPTCCSLLALLSS